MSEPTQQQYVVQRHQSGQVLAEVKGDHETIASVLLMVWGVVPEALANDPEEPDEKGEWKFHLGGADWLIVSRG